MHKVIFSVFCGCLFAFSFLLPLHGWTATNQTKLQPFVLAYERQGSLKRVIILVKSALVGGGFEVVGEYEPYAGSYVFVVTNGDLKAAALATKEGIYGAVQRVSLAQVGKKVQLSYTNPDYISNVYRMPDLSAVTFALEEALGKTQTFGATPGFSAEKLRNYHYRLGMEYFTDAFELASHSNYKVAVDEVANGLAFGKEGTSLVYRVDFPKQQQSLFGAGMKAQHHHNKYMDDMFIMTEIDYKNLKHVAHLPYEILVKGKKVYALHPRFRIAINFPDIKMLGAHNFSRLIPTPKAILKALTIATGGEWQEEESEDWDL